MASHDARYTVAPWLFLRLLGVVYFCAFASLAPQIVGLVGPDGILPAGFSAPTLEAVCVAGVAISAALVAGLVPLAASALLWLLYLWVSTACAEFLSYQWDALLLEAGLLAIMLTPFALRDRWRDGREPPRVAVWLMLWLLFRLMFGSGAVKLASGDPTWRQLTALSFHYETQPIPNPIAYYAHHLPSVFNRASTAATLAIELGAPLLIVGPRRARLMAAALLVGLQGAIALTGNFAFFNVLSVALCVFLVDDKVWLRVAQRISPATGTTRVGIDASSRVRQVLTACAAVIIVPISLLTFTGSLGFLPPGWQAVAPIARLIAPLRSINSYGLFAVMTTTRREIVVEGSNDGDVWRPYEFKYKPGDLNRRPPWAAPHQPQLDWQMWFAALGTFEENGWFQSLCAKLLQGSPSVLRLLEHDPFDGRPPRYVRAVLYRYRFTDLQMRRATGAWWTREPIGEYSPVMSLK